MERGYGVGYVWRNAPIGGWSCMLLVVERLTDGEIITISVLHFDVSFKCTLHLLNFEGTRCSMG
jgi:hypothetical protein